MTAEPTVENVIDDVGRGGTTAVWLARDGTDTDVMRKENAAQMQVAAAAMPCIGGGAKPAGTR